LEKERAKVYEHRLYEDNDDGSDSSDSDDDDDGGFNINVGPKASAAAVENKVHMIPEEERSTHFLAIRITNEDIIDQVNKLQENIISQEEVSDI